MELKIFSVGPFSTNCILLIEGQKAVIIDPGYGAFQKIKYFVDQKKLSVIAIWLTHSHWDHIADLAKCYAAFDVPVFVHKADEENIKYPGSDKIPCPVPVEELHNISHIKEGDLLTIGEIKFKVIHTPGHSPGSVCFYSKEKNVLISGDTLFAGSIGNLSLPTGQPEEMWKSLEKLDKLAPETKVFPGHGEITTIGQETWLKKAKEIFGEYI